MRAGVQCDRSSRLTLTERLRAIGGSIEWLSSSGQACSLRGSPIGLPFDMAPEYGATCAFFPIDARTLDYLRLIGKPDAQFNWWKLREGARALA